MMFVASAANVRASIFQLEQKSQWTVKAMAGNIIPGILRVLFSAHFGSLVYGSYPKIENSHFSHCYNKRSLCRSCDTAGCENFERKN